MTETMFPPAGGPNPVLGDRFADATAFAIQQHCLQVRKGTTIPYVSHLLQVAGVVLENGGDEEQGIAALLHDSIEDAAPGQATWVRGELLRRFGSRVLHLVEACTDADTIPKPPWKARKEQYLSHLADVDGDALLISLADKLHNASAILRDVKEHGNALWSRFGGGRDGSLWYYRSLLDIYRSRQEALPVSVVDHFAEIVREIDREKSRIPSRVVQDLIALGRAGEHRIPDSLCDPRYAWEIIMCGFEPWRSLGRQLDESALAHLIKGLVIYGTVSDQSGGSVSPVITVYERYRVRFPETEPNLAAWIVENRTNPYEPFGSALHSRATNYQEYMEARRDYQDYKEATAAAREREVVNRRSTDATQKLPNAVRRGDLLAVKALMERGADRKRVIDGMNLAEFASSNGRHAVAQYLLELERNSTDAHGDAPGLIPDGTGNSPTV